MALDLATIIPAAGLGGVFTWLGQATAGYLKSKSERENKRVDTTATMEQHRDKLTFELLRAAREEVAAARVEASELRSLQLRLIHFDEALDHIEAMHTAADPQSRDLADKRAKQFLVRMRRFQEAHGAMRNEAQIAIAREAMDILDKGHFDAGHKPAD